MNKKIEDKEVHEDSITIIEELKDDIKTVGIRATWLLGLLVIVILAMASLAFRNYGVELKIGSTFWLIKEASKMLCLIHLFLLLVYIRPLIVPKFEKPLRPPRGINALQEKIDWNAERLDKLTSQFGMLVSWIIVSIPASLIYALLLWYFSG